MIINKQEKVKEAKQRYFKSYFQKRRGFFVISAAGNTELQKEQKEDGN